MKLGTFGLSGACTAWLLLSGCAATLGRAPSLDLPNPFAALSGGTAPDRTALTATDLRPTWISTPASTGPPRNLAGPDIPLGATTLPPSAAENQAPPGAKLDVTPLTTFADGDTLPSALPFSGAYTRIVIIGHLWEAPPSQDQAKSTGRADTPTPMPYAERNRAARYFFPDKYDVNLSTKFKIGDYEETVPLATLTRVSDQNGEVWLRDLTYNRSSFPWFLVRDRTVPNVLVEFNGSRDYESGIAGAALQVALTGIRMVAPEAGVITTLSANATKDKANAIDRVLGRLFSNKLSERHLSDRDLNKWKPDGGIAVGLNLPIKDGDWNGTLRSVGTWTINFEAPRPSIFSDWYLCTTPAQGQRCKPNFSAAANEVYREKDAATILAYPLIKTSSGSLSIKDHLMQQSWFNNARTSMGGKAEADAFTANQFCADLVDHSVKLGLNASDANLMVWAVIAGIPAPRAMATKAWDAQKCKAAISAVTAL